MALHLPRRTSTSRGARAFIATQAAGACVLIAIWTAAPAGGQTVTLASFEGRYTFVGGQAERQRLQRAIDVVADRLDFFVREIARGQISRNIQPEPRIEIDVIRDGRVDLWLGAWGPLELTLDGHARRVRGPDGSDTRLSAVFRDGRVETRQESSRGHRDNWLTLSADTEYLFLQSRVGAPQLPEEIRYTLSYGRAR